MVSVEPMAHAAPALPSFYRRPLPAGCVSFSSDEGRAIFREALGGGTMESFFALAEQFHTQAEPAFCGLATLVMVLNALAIDPGRAWKGPWRWFSEEQLDCCRPLEVVARDGITLTQVACLARCNGANVEMSFAADSTIESFREAIRAAASSAGESHVVVAYERKTLGQTGGGHFSPVGGLHPARDLVLLLDVARFKYPPHWVSVEALFGAMVPIDPATGRSRGFMTVRRGHTVAPVAAFDRDADSAEIERFLRDLDGTDILVLAGCLEDGSSAPTHLMEILRHPEELPAGVRAQVERLHAQMAELRSPSHESPAQETAEFPV